MEESKNQETLTAEQMHQKKEEMINFYKDSMPYLQAQHSYEEMLCKIDEVRFKRANIQYQFAMMNAMPEEEEEEDTNPVNEEVKTEVPSPRYPKSKKLKTN
jgi:hypothetical protein